MSKPISVRSNSKQVSAHLVRIGARVAAASTLAAEAMAAPVQRKAVGKAPRNTGRMAASITVTSSGPGRAEVGPETDYARFPELGTQYQRAQHFLTDAAKDSQGEAVVAATGVFKAALIRA